MSKQFAILIEKGREQDFQRATFIKETTFFYCQFRQKREKRKEPFIACDIKFLAFLILIYFFSTFPDFIILSLLKNVDTSKSISQYLENRKEIIFLKLEG